MELNKSHETVHNDDHDEKYQTADLKTDDCFCLVTVYWHLQLKHVYSFDTLLLLTCQDREVLLAWSSYHLI